MCKGYLEAKHSLFRSIRLLSTCIECVNTWQRLRCHLQLGSTKRTWLRVWGHPTQVACGDFEHLPQWVGVCKGTLEAKHSLFRSIRLMSTYIEYVHARQRLRCHLQLDSTKRTWLRVWGHPTQVACGDFEHLTRWVGLCKGTIEAEACVFRFFRLVSTYFECVHARQRLQHHVQVRSSLYYKIRVIRVTTPKKTETLITLISKMDV